MSPKDLFSSSANQYAAFRPDYPEEFYEFLFRHVNEFDCAWDCATGNGQAAKVLSQKFQSVFATDISDKQMARGHKASNIIYSVASAEKTSFAHDKFDLITVAQAAHWFSLDAFYKEAIRVAKPNSLLALWGYGLLSINPDFDLRLQRFYTNTIGPYWDPERKLIDEEYRTIPFPFDEILCPPFHFIKTWNRDQLEGYLSTWSAVQKFMAANSFNPVIEFMNDNQLLFQRGPVHVHFPLFARVGRLK